MSLCDGNVPDCVIGHTRFMPSAVSYPIQQCPLTGAHHEHS